MALPIPSGNFPAVQVLQAVQPSDGNIFYDIVAKIYEGATSNFVQEIQKKVVWAWETTFETLKSEWVMISLIFFGIFAAFGFTWAIQATIVYALARFVTITWQDRGMQESLERITGENLVLKIRNEELQQQVEMDRVRLGQAVEQQNLNQEELERVRGVRDQIIVQRAPLLAQRDQLLEDNQGLREENERLRGQAEANQQEFLRLARERQEAVQVREDQNGAYLRAIAEAEELRRRLEEIPVFQEFNRLLGQGQVLYQQNVEELREQEIQGGNFGLEKVIPRYKAARENRNRKLDELIQAMPQNDLARIQLERILEISKDEVDHLERICQMFHLQLEHAIHFRQNHAINGQLVEV